MGFGTLALIIACGLAGPLLAGLPRLAPPLVVGELAAGVLVGRTGTGWVDPGTPTLRFLSDMGFALLMFSLGAALPLREPGLRAALGRGGIAAAAAFALAVPGGYLVAAGGDLDRPWLAAVLLASTSAAMALPALAERRMDRTAMGMAIAAWASIANVTAVMALPLVTTSGTVWRTLTGSVVVTGATVAVWIVWRDARRRGWFKRYRRLSKRRRWGLDLRIALANLFLLAWLAVTFETSILVAGFSAGVVVALIGRPRRLAWEVLGIAEGLFVPLFFVTLGAQLDLRALAQEPRQMLLAALLLAAGVAVHAGAALAGRMPAAAGLVAAVTMGVPAAAVALGLREGTLSPAHGAAVMAAALGSVAVMAVGVRLVGAPVRGEAPAPG
ncbi:MAG: cation:proton antiporter [Thermoleophilia bacterium]|nr:cation:proton antiporter [Thermoleophilia bacterium]